MTVLNRREALSAAIGTAGAALARPVAAAVRPTKNDISLAAWSLNLSFFRHHRWKNTDLPKICRQDLGISGIEFVNQFFDNPTLRNLAELKRQLSDHNIHPVLIMIDAEGDMSAADAAERRRASIAHRKWVDVADYLGCHAVRCNMGGPRSDWAQDRDLTRRAAESFHDLLDYSFASGINVVIENHGGASSDPDVLVRLMRAVDHPRFGTLPDFGNVNQGDNHAEVIRKLVPYAKGISVKAHWTMDGKHPGYSIEELIKICQEAGYSGYWGIESGFDPGSRGSNGRPEYSGLSAEDIWQNEVKAVMLTKQVLERTVLQSS